MVVVEILDIGNSIAASLERITELLSDGYTQIAMSVLGGFIAALTGYLTQLWINRHQEKRLAKRSSRVLASELSLVEVEVTTLRALMQSDRFKTDEDLLRAVRQQYWDTEPGVGWPDHLSYLAAFFPWQHLQRLQQTHRLLASLARAIKAQEVDLIKLALGRLQMLGSPDHLAELHPGFSMRQLVTDLEEFADTGKIRRRMSQFRRNNKKYDKIYPRYVVKVEKAAVEYLEGLAEKVVDTQDIQEYMNHWLSKQSEKLQNNVRGHWARLVFDVLLHSDKIRLVWGTCWLEDDYQSKPTISTKRKTYLRKTRWKWPF